MTKRQINTASSLFGSVILICLFYNIGFGNILISLQSCRPEFLLAAAIVTLLATAGRILKFKTLLGNPGLAEVIKIYLFSKIGKEVSFLGNFSPLVLEKFRNAAIAQKLLVERYIEVFCTLLFGFFASLILTFSMDNCPVFLLTILCAILAMTLVVTADISHVLRKISTPKGFVNFITEFRNAIRKPKSNEVFVAVIFLSAIATLLDFVSAFLIFKALGLEVSFLLIPPVWAVSGLVSIATFMQIGTGDWSAVYLYRIMAGIPDAGTAAMIVLHKLLLLVNLLAVLIYRVLKPSGSELKELTITLTERCNSKCTHCHIWAIPPSERKDLCPDFVSRIPMGLEKITLTGGEPLLYDNLADVVVELFKKKPKRIVITSNGLTPELMKKMLSEVREKAPEVLKALSFRFSYDAKGRLNDELRGVNATEAKLISSINAVKEYGIGDIGVTQACREENIEDISRIYDFAADNHLQYGLQLVHASKVYFNRQTESKISGIEKLRRQLNYIISRDLTTPDPRRWFRSFYHSFHLLLASDNIKRPSLYPCLAGRRYLFMAAAGDIRPCIFFEENYGNIFDGISITDAAGNNGGIKKLIDTCSRKCWLICTASQEIKDNPILGAIWIVKSWFKLAFSGRVL